uniref:T9SS type A sorting domain-containing protein n=1 Tax=Fodinibius sp. TaxID=1872440 RepID=UPI0035642B48
STAVYYDKTLPLREMEVILPGERDRSWKDGIIKNKSLEEPFRSQQADIPEGFIDPVLQTVYNISREVRGPVINIDGVGNVNGVLPPDTDGDVGPDHYFQMINLSFAIWDKEGNLLYGPVDNSTLWNGFIGPWTGTNDGDPIVLYDEQADRWMASQFAINTSNGTYWQLVAVSETSDPLGAYYRYAFQFSAFNDYPKLGIWSDAYYATFNMFGSYTRAAVAAFERDSMLVGAPARMVYYDQPGNFSMLPADFDGTPPAAGTPCYFAHLQTYSSQAFEIYEFNVDWSDPNNSSFTLANSLQPASFNPNVNGITQPGTSTKLDDLAMMLMYRLQYRNFGTYEVLMTNHTVNAGGRAGVRWYEFRKESGDWYIYQQGTYAPDTESRWMASIAMNGNGDIALGHNISGSSTYPSIYYTGRRAYDTLGQMTLPETQVISGTYSQSGINRWGDYACMSVDPTDDSTFWFTTEYRASGWKTRIISFDFGPILPPEVYAGNDTVICETEPFLTDGQASYQQSVLWETGGDGFFVDPTKPQAVYLRGQGDVTSGEVDLWVTAFGYEAGTEVTDSVHLAFARMAVANAGPDTTICAGYAVQLNGTASNYDTLYWTTEGDGTFDNDSILDPYYSPGPQDIENGWARLVLHASDTLPCTGEVSDKMFVNIDECTFLEEGTNSDLNISVIPNPARESFTFAITGVRTGDEVVVELLDLQGQKIFTQRFVSSNGSVSNKVSVKYIPKAVYVLQVKTGAITSSKKLLIQ